MSYQAPTQESRPALWTRLSKRNQSWLLAVCAFFLVGIYLSVWSVYAATHLEDRYEQLPAGDGARSADLQLRVLSMKTSETIGTTEGEPEIALANSTFVFAEIELVASVKEDYYLCSLQLVGPDKRTWGPYGYYSERALPNLCNSDDVKLGEPYLYEAIYQVPTRYVGNLYGLAIEPYTGEPQMVISPPAS